MIRHCVICDAAFVASPSDKKVTCSPRCRSERARRVNTGRARRWSAEKKAKLASRGQSANLKKGTVAAKMSPLSGPFETNQNALVWVIRSPEGETYTFRNLNLWLREHSEMLPGTVEQARAGLMQIKRSQQGKTKRSVNSWKGWTLVGWHSPQD